MTDDPTKPESPDEGPAPLPPLEDDHEWGEKAQEQEERKVVAPFLAVMALLLATFAVSLEVAGQLMPVVSFQSYQLAIGGLFMALIAWLRREQKAVVVLSIVASAGAISFDYPVAAAVIAFSLAAAFVLRNST